MEMQLFGDDLRVEVDIWELFQFHDRRDRTDDPLKLYDLRVVLSEPRDIQIVSSFLHQDRRTKK